MPEPIRILQILPTLSLPNGVASVAMNWYRNIDRTKVQFDFAVAYQAEPSHEAEIKALGGRVFYCFPSLRTFGVFKDIFAQYKYKTVHSHLTQFNLLYFPIVKSLGAKNIILHSHNTKYSDNPLKAIINAAMLLPVRPLVTQKIGCSRAAGAFLFGKNADFKVINNGINLDKFAYNATIRVQKRKEFNIADSDIVIGHIGRFAEQKNHNFLIDIFNAACKKDRNALLLLAGSGPLEEQIKQKVNALGLSERVKFLGVRKDAQDLYQAMDVFALPSFYEGLPVCGVEAQAAGLPCVFSSAISAEVLILPESKMEPLQAGPDKWADTILQAASANRTDRASDVSTAGFEIRNIAANLQNFYEEAQNA